MLGIAVLLACVLISIVVFRFTAVTIYNASDRAHFWHSSAMTDVDNTEYWVQALIVTAVFWGVLVGAVCLASSAARGAACTGSCLWCLTKHGYSRYMAEDGQQGMEMSRVDGDDDSAGYSLSPYELSNEQVLNLRGDGTQYDRSPLDSFVSPGAGFV